MGKNKIVNHLFFTKICVILLLSQNISSQTICDAIYIIEGKENARQPFGIETIECYNYEDCKQICINTVENNKIRFKNQIIEKDFYTFLAKRYCPYNWEVWLKNLNWYLTNKGEINENLFKKQK